MNDAILSILTALGGYLMGSVMYAYLLPRVLYHVDVRNYGDGNPGAFNVHLCTSMPLAFLAAALDIFKGMVPAACARYVLALPDWAMLLPLAGTLLGNPKLMKKSKITMSYGMLKAYRRVIEGAKSSKNTKDIT